MANALGYSAIELAAHDVTDLTSVQALNLTADDVASISAELIERFAEEKELFES
jgi:hypothetical protein